MNAEEIQADTLTVPQVAARLGVTRQTAHKHFDSIAQQAGVTPIQIGDRRYLPRAAVERLVENGAVTFATRMESE